MMDAKQVKNILEACLLVAGRPMSLRHLDDLFEGDEGRPDKDTIKACIGELQADYEDRGIELVKVASGYRLQSRTEVSEWVARLFPEKPPRYSRALLETLVLVAYRQPITRGEIEEIRGVAVSSNIVKTLQEREWVKEVGFKDVPGKPALLGTTKSFLDYFNLERLDDLPPLSEIKSLDEMDSALMEAAGIAPVNADDVAANDGDVEQTEGEATESAETAESEGDVFGAGEANLAVTAQADSEAADATIVDVSLGADEQEISVDSERLETADAALSDAEVSETNDDAPVTLAGIVSRLPSIEEAAVDQPSEDTTEQQLTSSSDPVVAESSDAASDQAVDVTADVDAETQLMNTISDFADEHQQEVEVRDELESQLSTRYTESDGIDDVASDDSEPQEKDVDAREAELVEAEAGEEELSDEAAAVDALGDAIDASSASPEILSDTFSGEPASARDTLH